MKKAKKKSEKNEFIKKRWGGPTFKLCRAIPGPTLKLLGGASQGPDVRHPGVLVPLLHYAHLNGREMSHKVKGDCKSFVKHFAGATTNCMEDYMKPSLRKDPNHIILHVGTNDLILDRTSQDIATSIVNLACSIKALMLSNVNLIKQILTKTLHRWQQGAKNFTL